MKEIVLSQSYLFSQRADETSQIFSECFSTCRNRPFLKEIIRGLSGQKSLKAPCRLLLLGCELRNEIPPLYTSRLQYLSCACVEKEPSRLRNYTCQRCRIVDHIFKLARASL